MSRNLQVEARLNGKFPQSKCRAALAQGGWIVEVVFPTLTAANRGAVLRTVEHEVRSHFPSDPQVFWKIFVYKSKTDRYLIDGTLHTVDEYHTPDGTPVTTLAAGDCIVRLTEFDGEVLLMGDYKSMTIEVSEAVSSSSGRPILPFVPQSKYIWLETQGGYYALDAGTQVRKLTNTSPAELEVKLRN
jgi:hypothetical protein